ncbi:DUF4930 family protein [Staphylococcus lutrae]|uniref:DUF4930 domain-containing protein n=1 Tax=Staphylococcus lutrae TaxID=155085 RepID=A0AAC9RMU8_9STAP|nr:DUF4930 family protein [Staphylococcus lutrae]ARJ49956.1 DUF4930 domain-containing protein [Staphylococcus lutrae]PNZ38887.1 DUF4930 domain-containing protein [Staphylococcus lutrae]
MRIIKSLIKLLIILILLIALVLASIMFVPNLKNQPWNPVREETYQVTDDEGYVVPLNGRNYIQTENDIFRNIPKSQMRNVFTWIDKYEFMQVNGLTRMGYDNEYLIAERDTQFILYRFGDDTMRVYTTEHDLYADLHQLGHPIEMRPLIDYQ